MSVDPENAAAADGASQTPLPHAFIVDDYDKIDDYDKQSICWIAVMVASLLFGLVIWARLKHLARRAMRDDGDDDGDTDTLKEA